MLVLLSLAGSAARDVSGPTPHAVAGDGGSFFFQAYNVPSHGRTSLTSSLHPVMDVQAVPTFLAAVNNAASY